MRSEPIYPRWSWWMGVMVLPSVLLATGIGLVVFTDAGLLPFDNPDLWWVGFTVPAAGLCYLYGLVRKRRSLNRFASIGLAGFLVSGTRQSAPSIRAGLIVLAILFSAVATLGPRWGTYLEKQKVRGVDVVVAVDVSRSMLARDVNPNRLERAKREILNQLVERAVFRRANRLALMAFAGSTSLRVPLTTDHLSFRSKLDALEVGSVPRGGTALAAAILDAGNLLSRAPLEGTKLLLVFTDGEDQEGGAVEAAQRVHKEQGVRVFMIGVGNPMQTAGAEVPLRADDPGRPLLYQGQIVFSKLDEQGLRTIADAGGGKYTPIHELHHLVSAIAGMWRTELTTEERQRHIPRYQWFLVAALGLLTAETLVRNSRKESQVGLRRTWWLASQGS